MSLIKKIFIGLSCFAVYDFGGMMNKLVMSVNQGKMPVLELDCPAGFILNSTHVCMSASTHLKILADWIYFGAYIYSPGDVVLFIGFGLMVLYLITMMFFGLKKLITR